MGCIWEIEVKIFEFVMYNQPTEPVHIHRLNLHNYKFEYNVVCIDLLLWSVDDNCIALVNIEFC